MRLLQAVLALSAVSTTIATPVTDLDDLVARNPEALHSSNNKRAVHSWPEPEKRSPEAYAEPEPNHNEESLLNALDKRKGGGGGRGSSGSSGGRSGGSSGSSGGRPISSYSFSPQSNAGGRTRDGSGQPPAYGQHYMGGATQPYTAGARSPGGRIAPYAFPLAGFAVFPGLWLYGAYAYPYYGGYHYNDRGQNRTSNITCLCQEYQVCGCDDDQNRTALAQQVTNGTGEGPPVNTSTVRTVDYDNGTTITYINGSLENGTTAPGGTEPSNESQISAAVQHFMSYAGYWLMVATVGWGVWMGGLP